MLGETIEPKGDINHETENFVDDSASIVSFEKEEDAKPYAETFIKLLVEFYAINHLKINKDKTAIMVFTNSNCEIKEEDIKLKIS